MSHVDEGTLHALLDGALAAADPAGAERVELHLAACPDCRARLEDAARLRDEASALLGAAEPRALAMPSFDAIRARAAAMTGDDARAHPDAARRSRRLAFLATPFSGFAWAASVVFAVGLGWLLRDTVEPEAFALRERTADILMADAEDAEDAEDAPPPTLPMAEESAPAPSAGAGTGSGMEARAQSQTPSAARAPQEIVVEDAAPQDFGPTGFQALAPPPPAPPAAAERRLEAPSRAEYDVAAADEVAEDGAAIGDPAETAAQPAVTGDLAGAAAPISAAAAADGWGAVSPANAGNLVDGELVRVAGATVVAAATRGTGGALEVRTVQRTPRGELVTLVQRRTDGREAERRAADAQAERPALERAAPEITVRLGDWSVTISAPVARERLEQLAEDLH